jgi:hypothetical protein
MDRNIEYNKKYYLDNKDKIKKYYGEKIECICGKKVSRGGYKKHRQSQLHHNRIKEMLEDQEIKNKMST